MTPDHDLANLAVAAFRRAVPEHHFEATVKAELIVEVTNRRCRVNVRVEAPLGITIDRCISLFDALDELSGGIGLSSLMYMRNPGAVYEWYRQSRARNDGHTPEHTRDWLFYWAQAIGDHCPYALDGDFSWRPAFETFLEEDRKLVMHTLSLPPDHYLQHRLWTNDPPWREETRLHRDANSSHASQASIAEARSGQIGRE